ncbi:hypothetical protein ACFVXG_23135 [Kitasatospora sp. NPDC058162]|uniref:hypothetical protein n=1 Tax=Kitasatospora sp. NPDC058162 TaxID=3346362 RepID=UPI0036DB8A65
MSVNSGCFSIAEAMMVRLYLQIHPWLIGGGIPVLLLLTALEARLAALGSRRAGRILGRSSRAKARAVARAAAGCSQLDRGMSEAGTLSKEIASLKRLRDELVAWELAKRGQFWATAPTMLIVFPALAGGALVTVHAIGNPVAWEWVFAPVAILFAVTQVFLRLDSLALRRGHVVGLMASAAADVFAASRQHEDEPGPASEGELHRAVAALNRALLSYGRFGPYRSAAARREYFGHAVAMAGKIDSAARDALRDSAQVLFLDHHVAHTMAAVIEGRPLALVSEDEAAEAAQGYRERNDVRRTIAAGAVSLTVGVLVLKALQSSGIDGADTLTLPLVGLLMGVPFRLLRQSAPELPTVTSGAPESGSRSGQAEAEADVDRRERWWVRLLPRQARR